jgi:hypothetical protein
LIFLADGCRRMMQSPVRRQSGGVAGRCCSGRGAVCAAYRQCALRGIEKGSTPVTCQN